MSSDLAKSSLPRGTMSAVENENITCRGINLLKPSREKYQHALYIGEICSARHVSESVKPAREIRTYITLREALTLTFSNLSARQRETPMPETRFLKRQRRLCWSRPSRNERYFAMHRREAVAEIYDKYHKYQIYQALLCSVRLFSCIYAQHRESNVERPVNLKMAKIIII